MFALTFSDRAVGLKSASCGRQPRLPAAPARLATTLGPPNLPPAFGRRRQPGNPAAYAAVGLPTPPTAGSGSSSGGSLAATSSWPCKTGELVRVVHKAPADGRSDKPPPPPQQHTIEISLDDSFLRNLDGGSSSSRGGRIPKGSTVELHWGVYRSSPHLWQHPADSVPAGSTPDPRSGAMRSPMAAAAGGYSIQLSLPASLAPLTLAFVLRVVPPADSDTKPHFITPLHGRHFSALVGIGGGSDEQPGVRLLATQAPPPPPAPAAPASGSEDEDDEEEGGPRRRVRRSSKRPTSLVFGGEAADPAAAEAEAAAAAAARQQTQQAAQQQQQQPQQKQKHSVNFAVRCRGAERVALVLLRPFPADKQRQWNAHRAAAGGGRPGVDVEEEEWGMVEIVLDPVVNRSGQLWHIAVEGLTDLPGLCYGWRLEGDVSWESGCRVQPDQLLLDPCCPSIRYFSADDAEAAPLPLPHLTLPDGTRAAAASSLQGLVEQQQQAAGAAVLAAQVAAAQAAAVGQRVGPLPGQFVGRPGHSLEELRLLEVDVRTFAQGKGVQHPGSFLGVAERVAHIKAVGANAVLLTPSYATARGIGLMSRAAVHYMAADPMLSSQAAAAGGSTVPDGLTSLAAAAEFRQMLSVLHAAGVEVLLQFDLTFTAEGTDKEPNTLSLRGLDYGSYYRGNGVLKCGDAVTREYLLQVLHFWAAEGVDGFCFINAENLVQDRDGLVLDAPPLPEAICYDPLLRHLKLVAQAADDSLLPRQGVRGFPHWGMWQQRNTGFGADMMAYMAEGTSGLLTNIAGRLTGSASVFDADWDAGLPGNLAAGRRPAFGINSITVLGRQSLAELAAEAAELAAMVAVAERQPAGPGAPMPPPSGPPPSAATVAKSLLALGVLALGVPIVPQDAVADLPMAHFVGVLMRLRRRLAHLLLPPRFDSPRDIRWHAADAAMEPIWDADAIADAIAAGARHINYLAFSVRSGDGQAVYVGINPHAHPVPAVLPPAPVGRVWERIVDTSLPAPEDALLEGGEPVRSTTYQVPAKAVVVLQTAVLEAQDWAAMQQQQQLRAALMSTGR